MSPRLSERHCRGHRCPSRHTLCWLHPGCEPGTTQSFLSFTLRDSFHFSSLALTPPRNKNRAGGGDEGKEVPPCRVPVCALHGYLFKKQLYSKKWFPAIWKTDRPARRWKVESCPLVYIVSAGIYPSVIKLLIFFRSQYTWSQLLYKFYHIWNMQRFQLRNKYNIQNIYSFFYYFMYYILIFLRARVKGLGY